MASSNNNNSMFQVNLQRSEPEDLRVFRLVVMMKAVRYARRYTCMLESRNVALFMTS
jgi:hypothetical protein